MRKTSQNAAETMYMAQEILKIHPEHRLWLLSGDLGSGKTTFVKGLAHSFGVRPEDVKSPTFTFVNEYPDFVHYDLYRLESEDPLLGELLDEHMDSYKLVLVEWPEKMAHLLLRPHLRVHFSALNQEHRLIDWEEGPLL